MQRDKLVGYGKIMGVDFENNTQEGVTKAWEAAQRTFEMIFAHGFYCWTVSDRFGTCRSYSSSPNAFFSAVQFIFLGETQKTSIAGRYTITASDQNNLPKPIFMGVSVTKSLGPLSGSVIVSENQQDADEAFMGSNQAENPNPFVIRMLKDFALSQTDFISIRKISDLLKTSNIVEFVHKGN